MKKKDIDFTKPQFAISFAIGPNDNEPRYLTGEGTGKNACITDDVKIARLASYNRCVKLGKAIADANEFYGFNIYLVEFYLFGLLSRRVLIARFNKKPKPRKFL